MILKTFEIKEVSNSSKIFFPFSLTLIFSFSKEVQKLNIHLILTTLVVSNEDKLIEIKFLQRKNIPYISVTLVVSKEDKSIDFKELQRENIHLILLTFFVLKEDEKFIEFKQ